jgi:fumarate reductase subunit D
MADNKAVLEETPISWWASKTIWASIAQIVVGILVSLGIFSADQGADAVVQFPDMIVGAITSVLGMLTFWGRYVAKKTVVLVTPTK